MFKLLHFSDAHLGYLQYGQTGRLRDFAAALDEVARIAVEQRVDLVTDTGDSFNSPAPDPYSVGCYRRFLEKLRWNEIPFLGIVGNHNYHEIRDRIPDRGSWFEAMSDMVIRPGDPSIPLTISNRKGDDQIWVVATDWMPSDKIDAFLSKIGMDLDCLFMHQSTEGFMPVIARPEMRLAQIDGKASYVGVGDIHVTKILETPAGSLVGSPGSTEMNRSDESPSKSVIIVTFEKGGSRVRPKTEIVPIRTRPIISAPCISTPDQIESLRAQIDREYRPDTGMMPPLVMAPYVRSLQKNIEAFKKSLEEKGISMTRFTPEPDVDESKTFVQEQQIRSTSMPDIIVECLKEEKEAIDLATTLWNSPENLPTIVAQFRADVEKRFAQAE